jgi:ATP-dependent RNA helicase RhlE
LQRLARHANTSASPARHPVRALILTPTRELAAQVEESVRIYGKYTGLRSTVVFGGIDMKPQTAALRQGVEFLVATPGRLLDHVQQKAVNLQQVEAFVLDEADRMLDMGFAPDVRRILRALPEERQTLLFSATISLEVDALARSALSGHASVEIGRRAQTAEGIEHVIVAADKLKKRDVLAAILQAKPAGQTLIFTRTKYGADKLVTFLRRSGITANAIHGDKAQSHRTRTLDAFRAGSAEVLVATDIAARGIDVQELSHVVNFDVPNCPDDYVHRVGRTARAEAKGDAFIFVSPEEEGDVARIERAIGKRLPRVVLPGFDYRRKAAEKLEIPIHQRFAAMRTQRRRGPRVQYEPRRTGTR